MKRLEKDSLKLNWNFQRVGRVYTKNNKFIPKTTDSLCNDLRVYFSRYFLCIHVHRQREMTITPKYM